VGGSEKVANGLIASVCRARLDITAPVRASA
jgi:hypothetical protein